MGQKVEIRKEGSMIGGWMLTFSDMNTLLLTFFVLLYSMSTIATDKFEEIFQPSSSVDGVGLLVDDSRVYSSSIVFDYSPVVQKDTVSSALNVFRTEEDLSGRSVNIPNGVEFQISDAPDGEIAIVLTDRLLYRPGETSLTEESRDFLLKVRRFLKRIQSVIPRRVTVEGHTDNSTPALEGYRISAQRAEAVLLFLLEDATLPPSLFTLVGYGSSKPFLPNSSDFNRAKNRRVRIVLNPPDQQN